jgi:hypothetical protein
MTFRTLMLFALAAAITLASVASAGPTATKQRVQFDTKYPGHTFTLMALQTGALKGDSGSARCTEESDQREVLRDGQQAWVWDCSTFVITGKRGTLVLRSTYTWIEAGGPYNIATGTWKVVRGTGVYAGVTGGGRSARVGTVSTERARYQGYLTTR